MSKLYCVYVAVGQQKCLHFLPCDELGTCRASLVCPKQFVLSVPIRSATVLTVMIRKIKVD